MGFSGLWVVWSLLGAPGKKKRENQMYLQNDLAEISRHLQNFAEICKILQIFEKISKISQNPEISPTFCKISQNFAIFCKILQIQLEHFVDLEKC